jgi:hypothetical protein
MGSSPGPVDEAEAAAAEKAPEGSPPPFFNYSLLITSKRAGKKVCRQSTIESAESGLHCVGQSAELARDERRKARRQRQAMRTTAKIRANEATGRPR